MTLWSAEDAAAATGGRATRDWVASGVSIDTRTLQPGDLFVALKAARDGHDFVAQALGKGAAAALVSHQPEGVAPDAPLLIVDDVQSALEALGRAGRARSRARVVAVTGSVGKTSTKEMLRAMLAHQGATHASEASYNNHWGVPLTLARMPVETDFAVIEIGMNHPGEIAPLARMARPHVALITTVAAAHLEAFGSIDGIAAEKASIIEGLEPGGIAILPSDIDTAPILREAAQGRDVHWFGRSASLWRLDDVAVDGFATKATAHSPDGQVTFTLSSPGAHFAMNALGALAACDALGAAPEASRSGLEAWSPYKGRGTQEQVALAQGGALTLFDDSYNANPASLAAALDVLAAAQSASPARRIAYIGDMKELGPTEAQVHADVAGYDATRALDVVHCIGPLTRHLHAALPPHQRGDWAASAADMAARIPAHLKPGDIVLIKASLSTGLARIVTAIRSLSDPHQENSTTNNPPGDA